MLEITEAERNHELLLTARNLRELGASPFPYIIFVIPRSLPEENEGEHFVLADFLKLNLGNSSRAVSGQKDRARAARGTLVRYAQANQPQSPRHVPQTAKKRKENKTRARQTKAVSDELEDFMDWTSVISNEPAEEGEMSSLVAEFSTQMRKRAEARRVRPPPYPMGNN